MDYNLAEKQGFILGLVLGCPFQAPLAECPANSLREMSLKDKAAAVNGMAEQTLDEIIMHHRKCRQER